MEERVVLDEWSCWECDSKRGKRRVEPPDVKQEAPVGVEQKLVKVWGREEPGGHKCGKVFGKC